MPANEPRVALEGSDRSAVPDARDIGPVAPDERIELTIRVRPARPGAVVQAAAQPGSYLSREQRL